MGSKWSGFSSKWLLAIVKYVKTLGEEVVQLGRDFFVNDLKVIKNRPAARFLVRDWAFFVRFNKRSLDNFTFILLSIQSRSKDSYRCMRRALKSQIAPR